MLRFLSTHGPLIPSLYVNNGLPNSQTRVRLCNFMSLFFDKYSYFKGSSYREQLLLTPIYNQYISLAGYVADLRGFQIAKKKKIKPVFQNTQQRINSNHISRFHITFRTFSEPFLEKTDRKNTFSKSDKEQKRNGLDEGNSIGNTIYNRKKQSIEYY